MFPRGSSGQEDVESQGPGVGDDRKSSSRGCGPHEWEQSVEGPVKLLVTQEVQLK